jgi:hypothetical protein
MADIAEYPLNFYPDDADLLVGSDEEATSIKGSLATDGLGPCIAVAIYSPETQEGYLAHSLPDEVPGFVLGIAKEFIHPETKAWLVGGGYTPELPNPRESANRSRTNAVDSLVKLGVARSSISTVWLEDSEHIATVLLDASTGELRIGITEVSDYTD